MPLYVMKCTVCDYEDEVLCSSSEAEYLGCTRPGKACSGVMEKLPARNVPYLHPHAIPTRRANQSLKYYARNVHEGE